MKSYANSARNARRALFILALAVCSSALTARAQLQISIETNRLVLRWSARNASLVESDSVDGPWRPLSAAVSPYSVSRLEAKKFYQLQILRQPDGPRTQNRLPLATVQAAVNRFKAADPDASFSFFNGHVDNFATSPKSTVPSYASNVLISLNLPTATREHILLARPVSLAKPAHDLDANLNLALPTLLETDDGDRPVSTGGSDPHDPPTGVRPPEDTRTQRPDDPDRLVPWTRPDARTLALENRAAVPILMNFLLENRDVFEVSREEFTTTLTQVDYQVGAFFRKATFAQKYTATRPVIDGRTLVFFDANWNVITISRMITTPVKLPVESLATAALSQTQAVVVARAQRFGRECFGSPTRILRAELGVDHMRRTHVWDVELESEDAECHWRTTVHANSGAVLNVTDLRAFSFHDAKVRRWSYPGGDNFQPQQTISTGQYTRSDRRLEHDFFWVMNDHRCDGDPETTCTNTSQSSTWCSQAYGTNDGTSTIRATVRTDRDWTGWVPSSPSETFAETHTYYWARQFCQWLKPALDALGVLPDSANDYTRVLIITDQCRSRARATESGYKVTTQGNKGEEGHAVLIPHRNPTGPEKHNDTCEGGACFDTPGNIAHELNHFFLFGYFGFRTGTDCDKGIERSATHEGILGTAVPQAFWHNYYGVGYSPATDKLYFSDQTVGMVHDDEASRMIYEDFDCDWSVANEDPYSSGRVAGQVMWEIYHGKKVNSNGTIAAMNRPATDTDFNIICYWAADLQNASTFQDRYEFANRVLEILDKAGWSLATRQNYYQAFAHHSLHWNIDFDYWH